MTYFAVAREAGPAWIEGSTAFEQPDANDHATFMNILADEGLVVIAGPLNACDDGRIRVLLIAKAESEQRVRTRLSDDPWAKAQRLVTTTVEPWVPLVGADLLPAGT